MANKLAEKLGYYSDIYEPFELPLYMNCIDEEKP